MSKPRKAVLRAGGRPPKHGARSLARHLAAGALDGRTWIARERAELLEDIGDDIGGWRNMTARERLTAEVAVDALLICRAIVADAFSRGLLELGADGVRLTPAVAKGLATYQGVATRALASLGLRPDKVDRLPSLDEYLARRAAAGAQPSAQTRAALPTHADTEALLVDAQNAPESVAVPHRDTDADRDRLSSASRARSASTSRRDRKE